MKGRTAATEMMEAPKSRKQPKDKLKGKMKDIGKPVMVAGAMRSKKMYGGGMTMGTKGVARGMGAAVKGGKFTDL
jgi:hypothetical protein